METMLRVDGKVDVTVSRTIGVGQILRINPSEAWLGIDSGIIKITHILGNEDRQSVDSTDHPLEKYTRQIESDIDVYLDMYEGTPEYSTELSKYDHTLWVVYEYQYGTSNDEWGVLTIEDFIEHSMSY